MHTQINIETKEVITSMIPSENCPPKVIEHVNWNVMYGNIQLEYRTKDPATSPMKHVQAIFK